MAVTWSVNNAEITTRPVGDNPTNWVTTLHWDARDGDARRYGTLSMPDHVEGGIVRRLEQMTPANRKAKLLEWLDEHLENKADVEASIAAELAEKADPATEYLEMN